MQEHKEEYELEEIKGGPGITVKREQQPNVTYLKDTENLKNQMDNLKKEIERLNGRINKIEAWIIKNTKK